MGEWVVTGCVQHHPPTTFFPFLATALAVLSSFLCSSISHRIGVTCWGSVYEVTGDTEYPLAGLPTMLVLGDYSRGASEDVGDKQLYCSQSRDGI